MEADPSPLFAEQRDVTEVERDTPAPRGRHRRGSNAVIRVDAATEFIAHASGRVEARLSSLWMTTWACACVLQNSNAVRRNRHRPPIREQRFTSRIQCGRGTPDAGARNEMA